MRFQTVVAWLCVMGATLQAQNFGEINGTVTDSTGAVLAGAAVTITNTGTNVARDILTNDSGNYTAPFLVPGVYNIHTQRAGFKAAARSGVELQVGAVARIDFQLEIGAVAEVVEVSGSAALLATEGTAIGTVIENKRIVELPLNGRNYLQLIALSPNVTAETPTAGTANTRQGGERTQQNFSIAGQRVQLNRFTLDGIDNTDTNFNTFVFRPSVDALQEFKVETGIYSAEHGRNPGQVNVTTKSGTNAYHGTVFEFLRNDKLDAREWNQVEGNKNPFRRNQYGFTFAGRVIRDRLFFMSNFEGLRDRKTTQRVSSVATDKMRAGDFSGQSRGIFDHRSRVYTTDAAGNPRAISATRYPGNIIPASLFNPIAQRLLEFYPRATTPGDNVNRNFVRQGPRSIDWDQFTQRIDFNENTKSFWFGRFGWGDEFVQQERPFVTDEGRVEIKAYQAMLSNTRTVSPSVVNELRFGYTQFRNDLLPHFARARDVVSELKIAGLNDPGPDSWGSPSVTLGNGLTGFGDHVDGPFIIRNHTFQLLDNLSVIRGKHSFRFGGELRRERLNQDGNVYSRAQFSYGTFRASYDPASRLNTGHSFADYLIGEVNQFQHALDLARTLFRVTSFALYGEDIWKLTPKLTLNLGLRYELTPAPHDKYRGFMNLLISDPGVGPNGRLANTKTPVLVRPGDGDFYQGMLLRFHAGIPVASGDSILGRATVATDRNDFAPRIGLAYSPNDRWSFRTGFGVFFAQDTLNPSYFEMGRNLAGRANILANEETPNIPLGDPYAGDRGTALCPGWNGPCSGPQTFVYSVDAARRTPYIVQWLFNVQRQMTRGAVVEVGYLGNEGHKLQRFRSFNNALLRTGPNDASTLQSRRPWPAYSNMQAVHGIVDANYHALSTKLTQRFSGGLTTLASFTWSKAIDTGSALRTGGNDNNTPSNPYDFSVDRGLAQHHIGRRLVTSFVYELPVGRGRAMLNRGGVVDAVLGGWQVSSILTFADGTPRNIGDIGDITNTGTSSRPDATGISPFLDEPTPQRFWNIAAFDPNNPELRYRFGNTGRSVLFNPGTRQWDFALAKKFRILEGHALDFRLEGFNFSNHPNWNAPGSDVRQPATFGVINTARTMREMQLGLKYNF